MIYVGIDNGVTGTVAIVNELGQALKFMPTPVNMHLNYTKKKANANRLDVIKFRSFLRRNVIPVRKEGVRIFMERPMVNGARFNASISAIRCLEATLICLESFKLPLTDYLDSKGWQKAMLPTGIKGPALKVASCDVGCRMWPLLAERIKAHGDADSLLIAEYARKERL